MLASGHVPVADAIRTMRPARDRSAQRFSINHPIFDFMQWTDSLLQPLRELDVHLEVGCMADLGSDPRDSPTARLASSYPTSLLVLGSELGHTEFPPYRGGLTSW